MTTTGRWLRHNLFAKPADVALTLVVVPFCAWTLFSFAHWVLATADWTVIAGSLRVLMVGMYPADQMWRAWTAAALITATVGAVIGLVLRPGTRTLGALTGLSGLCGVWLQAGGIANGALFATCCWTMLGSCAIVARLPATHRLVAPFCLFGLAAIFAVLSAPGLDSWGGLLLSVILTIVTSILAIPLGILLAFGRQSEVASLRILCTGYIEVMRSVPLILVVYWVWIVVPLLAPDAAFSGVLRGMAGYALFFAAYVAEYVRSGLQALPKGQVEAARSLGMGNWSTNMDIILPQALRFVVPALVGQILDIFNGATLVFIIGLTDLLRAGQMILANPQNSGQIDEVYAFMFLVYFAIGSMITFASRKLEAHLGKGLR